MTLNKNAHKLYVSELDGRVVPFLSRGLTGE
jgi:hypothetical protein